MRTLKIPMHRCSSEKSACCVVKSDQLIFSFTHVEKIEMVMTTVPRSNQTMQLTELIDSKSALQVIAEHTRDAQSLSHSHFAYIKVFNWHPGLGMELERRVTLNFALDMIRNS